jgi:hypothetical protein
MMNKRKKKGSALAAVFIICTAVALVAGSAMKTSTTERRMNLLEGLNAEARNAAEAIVEYGLADLQQRFTEHNSFASDELGRLKSPLVLPSTFFDIFNGSNITMPANPYDGTVAHGTYDTEIIGGTVPDAGWTFIDSTIPGNVDDPLADRTVFVRQVKVFGKATAVTGNGQSAIAYCCESLQVRDAPLFSYAMFYNMDLEIGPGVAMEITGPVHTNGNLYVAPNPSASSSSITSAPSGILLQFDNTVTAVGGVYHSLPYGYNDTGSGHSGDYVSGTGDVKFTNSDTSVHKSMYQTTWVTSASANWYSLSKTYWADGIQDAAYSVRSVKSVAFSDYVDDDPSTTATDDALNYAYQIIMPLAEKNITTATTTSPAYDQSIEEQKYAFKAGLVIVVHTNSTDGITGFALYSQSFDADGRLIYSGNVAKQTLLTDVTTVNAVLADTTINASFFGSSTATATGTNTVYASESSSSNNVASAPYTNSGIFRVCNYKTTTVSGKTYPVSGMYDQRRGIGVDLLEIDMNKLRAAIATANAKQWHTGLSSTTDATYCPKTWWNGIIYIQFDYDPGDTVGKDNVRKAVDGYGVRLTDAKATISGSTYTPGIPHPSWSAATGTTIATNGVMYTLGSYNTDGLSTGSGSATAIDNANEPAASLAADAITILSSSWLDYKSALAKSSRSTSSFTEVSAAFISGIVPTNKNSNDYASGGVNNFPRFLEYWSATVCYRGSMVCLYESEVADEPFNTNVFQPPTRNWGFNALFANGTYPPGTPLLRTYKRVNFTYLSKAQWDSETSVLP